MKNRNKVILGLSLVFIVMVLGYVVYEVSSIDENKTVSFEEHGPLYEIELDDSIVEETDIPADEDTDDEEIEVFVETDNTVENDNTSTDTNTGTSSNSNSNSSSSSNSNTNNNTNDDNSTNDTTDSNVSDSDNNSSNDSSVDQGYLDAMKDVEYTDKDEAFNAGMDKVFSDPDIASFSLREIYYNGQIIGYRLIFRNA